MVRFFCHGSAQNSPHIELARKSDWQALEPKPLIVEALDFHGFTKSTAERPWLIVLNCCEGAGVTEAADSQSLALQLVQEGVAPAVVGMREPVVSSTANQLTEALYSKLLTTLAERIVTGNQAPTPLDGRTSSSQLGIGWRAVAAPRSATRRDAPRFGSCPSCTCTQATSTSKSFLHHLRDHRPTRKHAHRPLSKSTLSKRCYCRFRGPSPRT